MKTDSTTACPKCGAPVPAEAPQGLCPACVFAQAFAPEPAPTATSQIPSLERLAVAFPQLQVLELIGRGGMGFVFKARQPHLDRFVALKLLPDSLAHDPQFAERFNREGRVLARLNHPNIVSIFDFGYVSATGTPISKSARSSDPAKRADSESGAPPAQPETRNPKLGATDGGFYYLMMEYVDGVNLRQAMQAGRFSPAEALTIVPKICEALQFAHEEGILHRDIKPENILLDAKGRVKIADFGIAKLVGEEHPDVSLTATGAALGTMHYMAPEQIEKPSTVDHRADIYSLGVVFYELLTGELPLGRFGPPSAKTPVDSRVDDVVMRTLEREREKRFQSAGEMGTTVEHLTEVGAGKAAPTLTPAEDFVLCPPRLPRMAKAIIVYALILAPLFWFLGLFTIEPLPEHALVKFVQGALNALIFGVEFLVLVVFAIGAWKLRALRTSAVGWLKTAFWLHLGLTVVAIAGQIWVEVLTDQLIPNAPAKLLGFNEGVVMAVVLATGIFEISALIWLRRHGVLLKSFLKSGNAPKGPRGTIVIPPSAVVSSTAMWSLKAVWGSVLAGVSFLPIMGLLVFIACFAPPHGPLGGWEIILIIASVVLSLPAIAGTILGWMALSDIRAQAGKLRGLSLSIFSSLTWPLGLLLLAAFSVAIYFIQGSAHHPGSSVSMMSVAPLLLVPAGALTFSIWAIYAAARWGGNKPPSEQRGVLKWVFLGLLIFGVSVAITSKSLGRRDVAAPVAVADTNTTPWIRFTFTAVELREVQGVRWLAIDYLDDVHGECQKAFPWENTIPGFTATTRATEFITDAKDGSPAVRHQRIEYRMPDSSPRDQLERLRDNLEKALQRKSFRLELRDNEIPLLLFELPGVDGGSLQARIKVMPPLQTVPATPQRTLGVLRLVGAGSFQNIALVNLESMPSHPLHYITARFSGPELPQEVALAPKAVNGPYVVPSANEDIAIPVTEPIANGDPVGTNQAPTASAIRVECPGIYSMSFVLPDENAAREADRQIKLALAGTLTLKAGQPILLFTIGERKAWLDVHPFYPAPNKFAFFRHGGRSPASASSSNHLECAVATIPPGHELKLVGRLMLNGQNRTEPTFGTTLTSGPNEPGVYWLTWYSLPNPQTMDDGVGEDWELLVHDAMGHELLRVPAPEELKRGWSRRWIGDSKRTAKAGEPIQQILFQKVETNRAGDRPPSYVNLEMTMHRSGVPDR